MKKIFTVFVISVVFISSGYSQFPEDALRLSVPGLGIGARSLGMGLAYTGVANDFSASYWNPAGLGQIRFNEVSMGLSNVSYGNTSTYLGNNQSLTNSSTSLNSFGLVYPVPTVKGSFVLAIGYGKQADYTSGLSYKGFNNKSSIIQSWAPNARTYPSDLSENIAYQLYLANIDTITGRFVSLIDDSVTQSGKVLEGGGLNQIVVSGAVEAARNLYLGGTLSFYTGSYSYIRSYYEDDIGNTVYTPNRSPFDFTSLSLKQTVESDLSGFTVKLGLLYKLSPRGRLGIAIKTPSWITVRETFAEDASSDFDNGDHFDFTANDGYAQKNEYDVATPFILSSGFSYEIRNILFVGDVEFTDWTQMEFRNGDARLRSFNTDIKEIFRPTLNIRLGTEVEVVDTGLRLRGGFAYLPSQYKDDPSAFAQKYLTAGIGFIVENSIAIDLGYAYGYWDTYHQIYDGVSTQIEHIKTHNLISTISYRF